MAPEVWNNVTHNGTSSDIWAMGCILYLLLFGEQPFDGESRPANQPVPPRDINPDLSKMLLKGMFMKPWKRRITIEQIRGNPWYTES